MRAVQSCLMNSNHKQPELTIGPNLGDRRHTVCVLNAGGDIVTEETIPNTRVGHEACAARFPAATVAMESPR